MQVLLAPSAEKMVDLGPKQRVPKKRNLRAWAQLGIAYGVLG